MSFVFLFYALSVFIEMKCRQWNVANDCRRTVVSGFEFIYKSVDTKKFCLFVEN